MNFLLAAGCLLATVLIYRQSKIYYRRFGGVFLSPLVISPVLIIILISVLHIPYSTYNKGGQFLSQMLGPATVAFAIPLHKHFHVLKKHALEIIGSVFIGSSSAVLSSMFLATKLNLTAKMVESIAPRSVTTPIAMDISHNVGGIPAMTAAFVILTAITGLIIGPYLIRYLHLKSAVAKGAMYGMGAHGGGTAKAMEIGPVEGTVASLSMILAAGITLLIAPSLVVLLTRVLHA